MVWLYCVSKCVKTFYNSLFTVLCNCNNVTPTNNAKDTDYWGLWLEQWTNSYEKKTMIKDTWKVQMLPWGWRPCNFFRPPRKVIVIVMIRRRTKLIKMMMIISHGHHVMTMVMMMKIMMMMNVAGGRWAAAEAWAAQASQTIIILYIGISVLVIVIIIIGHSFIMSRV